MTDLCNKVSERPEIHSLWVLLLIFPRCILPAVKGPRLADSYSQARGVRERLERWRKGEYRKLWEEAVSATKIPVIGKKKVQSEPSQEEKNAKQAARLAQEGQYTRSLQSLLSAGMAQHSRATVREMQAKHPIAQQSSAFQPENSTTQMALSTSQVAKEIKGFKRGTAPGPSGLRAEHLNVSIKSAPPNRTDKATSAITKLVNCMGGGRVPDQVAKYLYGARTMQLTKRMGAFVPYQWERSSEDSPVRVSLMLLLKKQPASCLLVSLEWVYQEVAKQWPTPSVR